MKEQLISFETAKLAKEKGFGLGENDYIMLPTAYELNGNLYNNGELTGSVSRKYNDNPNHLGADTINDFEASVFIIDNSLDEFILAPTQSLLQKFIRETRGVHIEIHRNASGYYWSMCKADGGTDLGWSDHSGPNDGGAWESFEGALENALQVQLSSDLPNDTKVIKHWGNYVEFAFKSK